MKFNKLFLLPACFLVCSVQAMATDDVTINVTGTIVASPCTVDPASVTKDVSLGDDLQTKDLNVAGDKSTPVTFDIKLTNCPAGTSSVTATFAGTADTTKTDMYANTGTATNVAVALEDSKNNSLGNGKTYSIDIESGVDPDFSLSTYAYAVGASTPGTISSVITMSLSYK